MTFYVTEVFVSLLCFSQPVEYSSAPSLPVLAGSAAVAALQLPPLSCVASGPAQLCSALVGLSVQETLSVTPGQPLPRAAPAGCSLGSHPARRRQHHDQQQIGIMPFPCWQDRTPGHWVLGDGQSRLARATQPHSSSRWGRGTQAPSPVGEQSIQQGIDWRLRNLLSWSLFRGSCEGRDSC